MKFSLREMILGWVTAVVVIFLPTWFFLLSPRLEATADLLDRQKAVRSDLEQESRLTEQAGAWEAKLAEVLKRLTVFPENQDVTADMLIKVEGIANTAKLTLTRREPQKEKRHGDIGSLDIKCNWEGSLDALVHFLFALKQNHAMLDLSQLYIKSENKGVLKGTFTVNCSYVRQRAAAAPKAGGPPPGGPGGA